MTMTNQAIIQKEIESLPPQYYREVIDFIGYLRHKAQQKRVESSTAQASSHEQILAREMVCITRHAEELNSEMEDVLLDQSWDSGDF